MSNVIHARFPKRRKPITTKNGAKLAEIVEFPVSIDSSLFFKSKACERKALEVIYALCPEAFKGRPDLLAMIGKEA